MVHVNYRRYQNLGCGQGFACCFRLQRQDFGQWWGCVVTVLFSYNIIVSLPDRWIEKKWNGYQWEHIGELIIIITSLVVTKSLNTKHRNLRVYRLRQFSFSPSVIQDTLNVTFYTHVSHINYYRQVRIRYMATRAHLY